MVKAGTKQFVRDRRTLHAMGFMVSIRPGDDVETEFGLMVDVLYKWYTTHGEACGELIIAFVAEPEDEESLLAYTMSLIQQEEPLRPLFIQVGTIDVNFTSPDGKDQKEFKFKVDE